MLHAKLRCREALALREPFGLGVKALNFGEQLRAIRFACALGLLQQQIGVLHSHLRDVENRGSGGTESGINTVAFVDQQRDELAMRERLRRKPFDRFPYCTLLFVRAGETERAVDVNEASYRSSLIVPQLKRASGVY